MGTHFSGRPLRQTMTKKKSPHFSILLNSKKVDKKINLVSRSLSELLGDMVRLREDNPLSYRSFEIERTPFDLRLFFWGGAHKPFFIRGLIIFFVGDTFCFYSILSTVLPLPKSLYAPRAPSKGTTLPTCALSRPSPSFVTMSLRAQGEGVKNPHFTVALPSRKEVKFCWASLATLCKRKRQFKKRHEQKWRNIT